MSYPFAGNQFFAGVQNQSSAPIVVLAASNVKSADLSSANASLTNALITNASIGPYSYHSVTGYSPTGFATLSAAVLSLANVAGASSTTSGNALTLPTGSLVQSVYISNNGTTVTGTGATNSIATSNNLNLAATTGTSSSILATAAQTSLTGINNGSFIQPSTVKVQTGYNYVNVTNATAANTAGSLAVTINYYLPA